MRLESLEPFEICMDCKKLGYTYPSFAVNQKVALNLGSLKFELCTILTFRDFSKKKFGEILKLPKNTHLLKA